MGIGEIKEIVLVDKNDEEIGSVLDDKLLNTKGLIVRATTIIITNKKGEMYLQLRSKHKYLYPLHWDCSVGGIVDTGETYLSTGIKEAKEEINIDFKEKDLQQLGKNFVTGKINEFVTSYKTTYEKEIKPQSWEVKERFLQQTK